MRFRSSNILSRCGCVSILADRLSSHSVGNSNGPNCRRSNSTCERGIWVGLLLCLRSLVRVSSTVLTIELSSSGSNYASNGSTFLLSCSLAFSFSSSVVILSQLRMLHHHRSQPFCLGPRRSLTRDI